MIYRPKESEIAEIGMLEFLLVCFVLFLVGALLEAWVNYI